MNKTIFITGSSSGIGKETAIYFQQKGWNVVATMRNTNDGKELGELDNVLVTRLDVTDNESIEKSVNEALKKFGKIDVLLNNAGYGAYGILEATSETSIRNQFNVNVIGVLMLTKHILPYMRAQGSGTIVNISSIGGKITFPLGTLYHGSKFAVEGMSEALSYELAAIGIKVKIIEPGMIDTNFAKTVQKDFSFDPSQTQYVSFVNKVLEGMGKLAKQPSEPIVVSKVIYEAVTDGTDRLRYPAGDDAVELLTERKKMNDKDFMAMILKEMGM